MWRRRKKTKQQEELLQRVNEETLRQGQARDGQGSTSTGRKISEIVAYQRVADMPSSKDLIIQVRDGNAEICAKDPCIFDFISEGKGNRR